MDNLLKIPQERWNSGEYDFIKFATQKEIIDLMRELEI